jgi:uncharacterized protein DUF4395
MTAGANRNFVLQQGLGAPETLNCSLVTSALLFQPRVIGLVVLVGTIWQRPVVFGILAAVLWWCSLFPRLNPFDFVYKHTLGLRSVAPPLGPAPAPRRFAQGMAAAMATGIVAAMMADFRLLAWLLEGVFLVALAALLFGRFCLGSFVYHLLRGRLSFAMDTLPWGRGA